MYFAGRDVLITVGEISYGIRVGFMNRIKSRHYFLIYLSIYLFIRIRGVKSALVQLIK